MITGCSVGSGVLGREWIWSKGIGSHGSGRKLGEHHTDALLLVTRWYIGKSSRFTLGPRIFGNFRPASGSYA